MPRGAPGVRASRSPLGEVKELETKARKLEAAERQIADLKRLFEVRRSLPQWTPEISEYYYD